MFHAGNQIRRATLRTAAAIALVVGATWGCAATPGADAVAAPPAPHVEAALDDAARSTGVPRGELKVVSVEQVTWRDAALGCPEPGMMYTQALVAGYRITIGAAGKSLDYHADQRGRVLLCPPERAVAPLAPPPAAAGHL